MSFKCVRSKLLQTHYYFIEKMRRGFPDLELFFTGAYRATFAMAAKECGFELNEQAITCKSRLINQWNEGESGQFRSIICLGALSDGRHVHARIYYGFNEKMDGVLYYCELEDVWEQAV